MRVLGRVLAGAAVLLVAAVSLAWLPKAVVDDPLVRMPGTQPGDGVVLESPNRCFNCHDAYDPNVDIGTHWRGAMMSQAMRDPLFYAGFTAATPPRGGSAAARIRPTAARSPAPTSTASTATPATASTIRSSRPRPRARAKGATGAATGTRRARRARRRRPPRR